MASLSKMWLAAIGLASLAYTATAVRPRENAATTTAVFHPSTLVFTQRSGPQTTTLTNTGSQTLQIFAFAISGPNE